jgi:hypothetical protein
MTPIELSEVLVSLEQELIREHPELAEIIQSARSHDVSVRDAIREIWLKAAQDPELASKTEETLLRAFGVESATTSLAQIPDREQMLERWGFNDEDLVYQPIPDKQVFALHPVLMGLIVELLQFDGDVPELRTGKLPEGGSPAVPVATVSRDPVLIGAMLKQASREVAGELEAAQEAHNLKLAAAIDVLGGTTPSVSAIVRRETERGIGVPGYLPGHRAAMRTVATPTAGELAALPFEERQELAHKTLTSTQGRRSATPVIESLVLQTLHDLGYTGIIAGDDGTLCVEVDWTTSIDGSKRELNPRFNFIDVAARSLAAKLQLYLAGNASRYTRLRVKIAPVNTVSERDVGWKATLFE